MKKLLLEEDDIVREEPLNDNQLSNLITQMIQQEWASVDFYNSMLITLQEYGGSIEENVIQDIINNHYTSIGQLEGLLQEFSSEAKLIDTVES